MQIWQNDAMKCPNCSKPLQPEKIGSTVYWRCSSCGALWFDNKENDFLTEDEAKTVLLPLLYLWRSDGRGRWYFGGKNKKARPNNA